MSEGFTSPCNGMGLSLELIEIELIDWNCSINMKEYVCINVYTCTNYLQISFFRGDMKIYYSWLFSLDLTMIAILH